MKDFAEVLSRYNFQDEHGHALENCEDYQELLLALKEIHETAVALFEPVAALTISERCNNWKVRIFSDDMCELLLERHDKALQVLVAYGNDVASPGVAVEQGAADRQPAAPFSSTSHR